MIVKADSVEVSTSPHDNQVKVDLYQPDFSAVVREADYRELLRDLDPGMVLDTIGKEAAMEYFNLKEDE